MKEKQTSELITDLAELDRQFKLRLEKLEHEHTMRMMGLFQEFKARAFAIRNKKPMADDGNGMTITLPLAAQPTPPHYDLPKDELLLMNLVSHLRRGIHKHKDEKWAKQASEYLERKGIVGNILRSSGDDQHASPVAPGEQPPRDTPEQQRIIDAIVKGNVESLMDLQPPAPPAQELASEQAVMDKWREHPFPGSEKGMTVLRRAISEALATAAKQAREERDNYWAGERTRGFNAGRREGYALALEEAAKHEPQMYMKDRPITGVNGAYTIAFSGCSCGWNSDGEASEKEKWGDHIRALAAQPSPQKENVE